MVVGADTQIGRHIINGLLEPDREVRAFVSDATVAADLKKLGVKTALGDVSDESHVGAACTNVFTAILVGEAARDGRERSFAENPSQVTNAWARAVSEARVKRVLWVGVDDPPATGAPEAASVDPEPVEETVRTLVLLDSSESIRDL